MIWRFEICSNRAQVGARDSSTYICHFLFVCLYACVSSSDGSGPKIFDPGRVSHLGFGFEFGKFPLKMSNLSMFSPSGQKKSLRVGSESTWIEGGSASYLLQVKRKLGSGQGPSLLSSREMTQNYKSNLFQISERVTGRVPLTSGASPVFKRLSRRRAGAVAFSLATRPGQNFLTRIGSDQPRTVWV